MQALVWVLFCGLAWSQRSGEVSIPVRLFESKCTLSGPKSRFSVEDLTRIHDLSPEKTLTFSTSDAAKDSVVRLDRLKAPAPELESYLSQSRVYALKLSEFLQKAEALKTDKNKERFLAELSAKLTRRQRRHLEDLASRVLAGEETEVLIASFGETLGVAPDEEFHRAIRRMKINYNCVFDRGR